MPADWPYPFWIAHRGAGRLAPENTLAAFQRGAALGYRAFECDVKLSADGVPFLLHDATLDRTTSASGPVAGWAWSALARLDAGGWHGAAYQGEALPALEAVAGFVKRGGQFVNLEIKPVPGTEAHTGRAVAAAAARLWAGVTPPLLSSFSPQALIAARAAAPALPRALLVDTWGTDGLAAAADLGAVAVIAHHPCLTADRIACAHGAGLRVLAYTVNEPDDASRLIAWGIDGLITDAVDLFTPRDPRPAG